jgi:hypothetical protein
MMIPKKRYGRVYLLIIMNSNVVLCVISFIYWLFCFSISTFKKRFGPHSISLIYEVKGPIPFHPQGYVCPDSTYEAPQGIHSFPFIYCYPKVYDIHWIYIIVPLTIISKFRMRQIHIYQASFPSSKAVNINSMIQGQGLCISLIVP